MTRTARRIAAALPLLCLLATAQTLAAEVDESLVADAIADYAQGRFEQARPRFEAAATAGSAAAQYHLGLMYARGEGTARDFRQAAHWFGLAAEQDHAHSQFILGHMYARGDGVERDLVAAHVWFSAAAAAGWWKAREARERLVPEMTPAEVARASTLFTERARRRDPGTDN